MKKGGYFEADALLFRREAGVKTVRKGKANLYQI